MSELSSLPMHPFAILLLLFLVALVIGSIRMAQEYERAVIFRFGRVVDTRGPGLFFKLPLAERAAFVDLRTITRQLETQETVTRDGVAVKVNAVLWYQATDPVKTVVEVADWNEAVRQAAETAMRDTVGQNELDHLLKDRLNANFDLKTLLTATVQKWGVEISAVELKDLDIPENMQRAIAKEAEAIREKRARIIKAEGEMEAADKLNEAAQIMSRNSVALELRRLQTLTEIGAEHNSVIIVAMPTESNATAMTAGLARAVAETSLSQAPQAGAATD
jgi:regulator of protease activity HflC (stomatin/prohibitin superfamily)